MTDKMTALMLGAVSVASIVATAALAWHTGNVDPALIGLGGVAVGGLAGVAVPRSSTTAEPSTQDRSQFLG